MKKTYLFVGRNGDKPITLSFNRKKVLSLRCGDKVKLTDEEFTAYSQFFILFEEPKEEEIIVEPVMKEEDLEEIIEEEYRKENKINRTVIPIEITEIIEVPKEEDLEEKIEESKYNEEDLLELKNKELKEICKELKIDDKGNKKKLVERILENI